MNQNQIIAEIVENLGYALVDIEREGRGLLRVTIENKDYEQLINVGDCEKVSHQLTYTFAVENIPYERLEVSSPGLDRPIKSGHDFVRFAGCEVNLKLRVAFSGRKNFTGILQGLLKGTEDSVDAVFGLAFKSATDEAVILEFSLAEVDKARLVPVVDFKGRKS